jgi:hypothetical protein
MFGSDMTGLLALIVYFPQIADFIVRGSDLGSGDCEVGAVPAAWTALGKDPLVCVAGRGVRCPLPSFDRLARYVSFRRYTIRAAFGVEAHVVAVLGQPDVGGVGDRATHFPAAFGPKSLFQGDSLCSAQSIAIERPRRDQKMAVGVSSAVGRWDIVDIARDSNAVPFDQPSPDRLGKRGVVLGPDGPRDTDLNPTARRCVGLSIGCLDPAGELGRIGRPRRGSRGQVDCGWADMLRRLFGEVEHPTIGGDELGASVISGQRDGVSCLRALACRRSADHAELNVSVAHVGLAPSQEAAGSRRHSKPRASACTCRTVNSGAT